MATVVAEPPYPLILSRLDAMTDPVLFIVSSAESREGDAAVDIEHCSRAMLAIRLRARRRQRTTTVGYAKVGMALGYPDVAAPVARLRVPDRKAGEARGFIDPLFLIAL
jgi:hypothetical protein